MKPYRTIYFSVILFIFLWACNADKNQHYWDVYSNSIQYKDYTNATVALQNLLVLNPTNESILDSLANTYYQNKEFFSCLEVCKEILGKNSNNTKVHLLAGESAHAIGNYELAWFYYQHWIIKYPQDIPVLYNASIDLYNIQQADSAIQFLKKIVSFPQSREKGLAFNTDGQNQIISYYAASLNILGFIHMQQGDFKNAEIYFKEALNVQPDFILAKNNLDFLHKNFK